MVGSTTDLSGTTTTVGSTTDLSGTTGTEAPTTLEIGTPAPVLNPVTKLGCPYNGSITWRVVRSIDPTPDEADAYERMEIAMSEAVQYYECFTDVRFEVLVYYRPSVRTAQAYNTQTFEDQRFAIEFGADRYYMTVRVAMHELSHCSGVALAPRWNALWNGDDYIGPRANQELTLVYSLIGRPWYATDYGNTLVTLDNRVHFSPFGLLSEWEQESTDHLIANCRIVMAIRVDLGLPSTIVN